MDVPHRVTYRVQCTCGQRFTHLLQCLCTVIFNTDTVTGTARPQILTCPVIGPNVLRKADYTTLSLNTQGDTCNNTTNKRVTTILLMLILINKSVNKILVSMENLISFVTLIFLDLKRGGRILFLGNSENIFLNLTIFQFQQKLPNSIFQKQSSDF